ncbi:MAG: glutamine amidotransferase, partial [Planctomycetia bacterium]|nr:glutamine amidotransferase [Planctomycetia bacterium]
MATLKKVAYLGDGSVTGAAAYLAGVLTHFDIPYDRVDSDRAPSENFWKTDYAAYLFSDYPAEHLHAEDFQTLLQKVHAGAGLVMLGGWESFHGRLGEYHQTPLAEALPVKMLAEDDRRNVSQPLLVVPAENCENHPILQGLPWNTPPGIGGFNAFLPKETSETVLEGVRFQVDYRQNQFTFQMKEHLPLLVTGKYGEGRTAALATDVAPHWVGGWVDWGKNRLVQDVPGGDFIDVGEDYARFFRNLVVWSNPILR